MIVSHSSAKLREQANTCFEAVSHKAAFIVTSCILLLFKFRHRMQRQEHQRFGTEQGGIKTTMHLLYLNDSDSVCMLLL